LIFILFYKHKRLILAKCQSPAISKSAQKKHKKHKKKSVAQVAVGAVNRIVNPSSSSSDDKPATSGLSDLSPLSSGSLNSFKILDPSGNPIKHYTIEYLINYVGAKIYSVKQLYEADGDLICPSYITERFREIKTDYDALYLKNMPGGAQQRAIRESLKALLSVMYENEQAVQLKKANERTEAETAAAEKRERERERERNKLEREAKQRELSVKEMSIKWITVAVTVIVAIISITIGLTAIFSSVRK